MTEDEILKRIASITVDCFELFGDDCASATIDALVAEKIDWLSDKEIDLFALKFWLKNQRPKGKINFFKLYPIPTDYSLD